MSTQSFAVIAVHKNSKMYAQNTNVRPHPDGGMPCQPGNPRAGRLSLRSTADRMSRAWVLRAIIAPNKEYSAGD